ncbi:hypothetical protein UFOVP1144_14 [uncultured Caudovirales phage]|uniref:Uncharacterized protein n=1 Tax=uncultured Caudovirales phage TaxID=2100421 RepID=A0A6J5QRK7_9CAUD|nr:hypothetical protein UFOVP1144_14 [uncultured Caudovirales phage]
MKRENRLYGLTRAFRNVLDKGVTLSLLKRFRRLAQAASRIACAIVSVLGMLLLSSANAAAPIHDGIQIQQTPKAYAKAVLPLHEFKCVNKLYYYESRWNHKARNGSHYGIPQGRSIYLKTATGIEQIKWGLKYNKNRYGSNCNALAFFRENNYH